MEERKEKLEHQLNEQIGEKEALAKTFKDLDEAYQSHNKKYEELLVRF
jgi:hypothetical protein